MSGRRGEEGAPVGAPTTVTVDGEEIERVLIDSDGDGAADRAVGRVYAGGARPVRILFYDDGADDWTPDYIQHIDYDAATGVWTSFGEDMDGDGDLERRSTYMFKNGAEVSRLWESDSNGDGSLDTLSTFDVALDRVTSQRRKLDLDSDGSWDRMMVRFMDDQGRVVRTEFQDRAVDGDVPGPTNRAEHVSWDPAGRRWAAWGVDEDGDGDLERRSTYVFEDGAEARRLWESDPDGDGSLDTLSTFDIALDRVTSWRRLLDGDGDGAWDRVLTHVLDERGRIVRTESRLWDAAAGTAGALERADAYTWHESGFQQTAALDHDGDGNADKHTTFFLPDPPPAARPFSYLKRWKIDTDDDGTFDVSRLIDPVHGDRTVGESFDLDEGGAFTRQERYTFDDNGLKLLIEFDADHDDVFDSALSREYGAGALVVRTVWYDDWTDGAALADQTPDRVLTVEDDDGDGTGESRRHDTLADDGRTVAASLFDGDNDGQWERAEAYERRGGVVVLTKTGAGADPQAAAPVYDAAEARVFKDGVLNQVLLYDRYDGSSDYDALLADGTASRAYRYGLGLDGDGSGDDARYDKLDGAGRAVESLFDIDADGVDRAEAYVLDAGGRRTETRFHDSHTGTFDLSGLTPDRVHRHGYDTADLSDPRWLTFSRDDDADGNPETAASRTFHPSGAVATRLTAFDDGAGGKAADDGTADRKTLETFDAVGLLVSTRHDDDADGNWDRTVDSVGSRRFRFDGEGRVTLAEFDENGDGVYTRAEAYRYGAGGLKTEIVYYDDGWLLDAAGAAMPLAAQTPDRALTVEDADGDGTGESRRHDEYADDGETVAASLFDTDNDPNGHWERAEAYERRGGAVVLVKIGTAAGSDPKAAAPVYDAAEAHVHEDGVKTQTRLYDRYDGTSDFDAVTAETPGRIYHYRLELDADGSDDARYDKLDAAGRTVESLFDIDSDGPDRAEAYVLDSGGRRTEIRFHDAHEGTFDLSGLSPDRTHRYAYDVGDSSDPDWLSLFRDDNGDGNFERSVVRSFHPGGGVAARLSSFDDGAGAGTGTGTAEDGAFDRKTLETFDQAGALVSAKHDDDNDGRWDRIEDAAGARRYRYDGEGRTVLIEHDGDKDGVYTRAEAWTWDGAAKSRIDFYDEGGWSGAPGAANTPDRVHHYGLELDADGADDARYDTLDGAGRVAESLFDIDADGVDRAEAYSLDAAGRRTEVRFHDSHTGTFDLAGLTPDRTHRFGWNTADAADTDWLSLSNDDNGDGNFERSVVRVFHPGGGVATRLSSFDDGAGDGTAEDGTFDRRTLETFDKTGALVSTKRDDDNDGLWDRVERPGRFASPDGSRTSDMRRETLDAEGRVAAAVFGDGDGSWGEEHSYGGRGKVRTDFYDPWPGADGPPANPDRSDHFGRDFDGDGTADVRRDTLDDAGRVVLSVIEDGAGGGARAEAHAYGTTDADRDRVVRTVHYDDWTAGAALEDQTAARTMDFFYDNGPLFASRYRRIGADGVAVEKGWDIDNDGVWDWVENYRFDAGGRVHMAFFDIDGDGSVERSEVRAYDDKGRLSEIRQNLDHYGIDDRILVHTWTDGAISETAFRQREHIRRTGKWNEWTEAYTRDGEGRVVRVDYHDDGDASGTPDRVELYTLNADGLIAGAKFYDDGDVSGTPDDEASYAWNVPAVRTVFDSESGSLPHRWIELHLRDGTFLGTLSDPRDDGVDDTVDFSGSQVGFGDNPQTLHYDFYRREGHHSSGTYDFLPRRLNEPGDLAERLPVTDPHGMTVVGPPTDWVMVGPLGDDTIILTRAIGDATADLRIGYGADEYVLPPGGTGSTIRLDSWTRFDIIRIEENIDVAELNLPTSRVRYGDNVIIVGPGDVTFRLKEDDFAFGDTDVFVTDADGDGTPEARTIRRYRGELTASETIELDFDDDDAVDRVVWRTFDPDGRFAASLTDRDNDGVWDSAVSRLLGSGADVRLTRFADALDGGRPPTSWDRVERHAFRGDRKVLTEFDEDGDGRFERAEAYEYDIEGRTVRVAFHDAWDDAARDPGRAPDRIHRWTDFGPGVHTRREDNDADGTADIVRHNTVDAAAGRIARAGVDIDADGDIDRIEAYRYFPWNSPFDGELERIDFHDNGPGDASANRYHRYGDDGAGGLVLVEKGFDADGDGAIDWTETYTAFDAEGRISAAAYDTDGDGAVDRIDRIRYDSGGRPAEVRRDFDADGEVDRILVHTWTFGRISETAVHRGGVRKPAPDWIEVYGRDGEGRIVRVDYHDDGDAAGAPDRVEEYKLDADGLIVQARFHDDGDAASAPDETADYEWNDPAAGANPPVVLDPLDADNRPHRWILLRNGADAVGKLGDPRLDGADDAADFRGGTDPVAAPAGVIPRLLNQAEPELLTIYAPRSFTELRGTGLDEVFVLPADRLDGGGQAPELAGGGGADVFALDPSLKAADGLRILDFAPGEDRLRYAGAADADGDGDTDFDDLRAGWSGAGTAASTGGFTEHPDTRLGPPGGELSVVLDGVAWRSQRVGGRLVATSELGPDDVEFPGGARAPAGPRRHAFDELHRVVLTEFDDSGDGTYARAEAYRYGAGNLIVETTFWDDWDQDAARSSQVRDRTLAVADADGDGDGESRRHDRYAGDGETVAESLFDDDDDDDGGWDRAEAYERDAAGRTVLVKTDPEIEGADPRDATIDYAGRRAEIRILDGDGATTELRFFDAYDGTSDFAALAAAVADRAHRFGLELDGDGSADDARHDRLDAQGRPVLSLLDHGADGTWDGAEGIDYLGASDDRIRAIRFGDASGGEPETADGEWSRGERYTWNGDDRKTLVEFDDSGDGTHTRAEAYEYGFGGLKTKTFWYDDWAVGPDGAALPLSGQTADRMLHSRDSEPDGTVDSRLHAVYDDAGRVVERMTDAENDGVWDGAEGFEYDADGVVVLEKSGGSIAGADPATAVIDYDSAEITFTDPAAPEIRLFDDYDGTSDFAALAGDTPDRVYRLRRDLDGDGSADDARYDKLDGKGRIVESLFDLDSLRETYGADRAEAHRYDEAGRRTETRFHDSWTGTFDLAGASPDRIHKWTYDDDTADGRWRIFTEDADADGGVDSRQLRTYGSDGLLESAKFDLDDDGVWDRIEFYTWYPNGALVTRLTSFDDGRRGGTADDGIVDIRRLEIFDAAGRLASARFTYDRDGTWDEIRTYSYRGNGVLEKARIERDDGSGGGTADDGKIDSVTVEGYDADGLLDSVKHDHNNNGTWDRTDLISRHANGEIHFRLASFDDGSAGGTADDGETDRTQLHAHDAAGREISVHYDDDAAGRIDRARRYAYDAEGRLVSDKSDHDNDGADDEAVTWTWSADGRIATERTAWDDGSAGGTADDGEVDAARLRAFDAEGRTTRIGFDDDGDGIEDRAVAYEYGAGDLKVRTSWRGDWTDEDGGAPAGGPPLSRVLTVTDGDGDGTGESSREDVYDAEGAHVARSLFDDDLDGTADRAELHQRDAVGRPTRTAFHDEWEGTAGETPDRVHTWTYHPDGPDNPQWATWSKNDNAGTGNAHFEYEARVHKWHGTDENERVPATVRIKLDDGHGDGDPDDGTTDRNREDRYGTDGRLYTVSYDSNGDGAFDYLEQFIGVTTHTFYDTLARRVKLLTDTDGDGDRDTVSQRAFASDDPNDNARWTLIRTEIHEDWDGTSDVSARPPDRIHHQSRDFDGDGASDDRRYDRLENGKVVESLFDFDSNRTVEQAERHAWSVHGGAARKDRSEFFDDHDAVHKVNEDPADLDAALTADRVVEYFYDNGSGDLVPNRHRELGTADAAGARAAVEKGFDTDGDGAIDWVERYAAFDAAGRPTRVIYDAEGYGLRIDEYAYDGAGRLIEVRRDLDGDGTVDRIAARAWDTAGDRIGSISHHDGAARKAVPDRIEIRRYDEDGRLVRTDHHDDGVAVGSPDRVELYTTNEDGLIVRADFYDDGKLDSNRDGETDEADETAAYVWNDPAASGGNPLVVFDSADDEALPQRWVLLQAGGTTVGRLSDLRFDGGRDLVDFRGFDGGVAVSDAVVPRTLDEANAAGRTVWLPSTARADLTASDAGDVFIFSGPIADPDDHRTATGGAGADAFILHDTSGTIHIRDFDPADGDRLLSSISERFFFHTFRYGFLGAGDSNFGGTSAPVGHPEQEGGGLILFHDTHPETFGDWEPPEDREEEDHQDLSEPGDAGFDNPSFYDRVYVFALSPGVLAFDFEL